MNTKMIAAASIAVGSAVFAATPKELADAGDWQGLVRCGFAATTNNMPKDKVLEVADAAIATSNSWYVTQFARAGLTDYETAYKKFFPVLPRKDVAYLIWGIIRNTKDAANGLAVMEKMLGSKDVTVSWVCCGLAWCAWNGVDEAEFLRVCTKAIELKDYASAVAPYMYCKTGPGWAFVESDTLHEWRVANYDKVVPAALEIAKAKLDDSAYRIYNSLVWFEGLKDLRAGDKSSANAMKLFDASMYGDKNTPKYSDYYCVNYKFGQEMLKAFIKNANNAEVIYNWVMTYLLKSEKAAGVEALNSAWYKLGKDKKVAFKAAAQIGDADKIIDALLLSTNNLTADDINIVISTVVGLDADHRPVDVVKVLKNINAKYTLKLYDDRDTWEPILSKVRALIDCR